MLVEISFSHFSRFFLFSPHFVVKKFKKYKKRQKTVYVIQVFCTSLNGNTYGTKYRLSEVLEQHTAVDQYLGVGSILPLLMFFLLFCLIFPLPLNEKKGKTCKNVKNKILNSEQGAKHPFAGWNIQPKYTQKKKKFRNIEAFEWKKMKIGGVFPLFLDDLFRKKKWKSIKPFLRMLLEGETHNLRPQFLGIIFHLKSQFLNIVW